METTVRLYAPGYTEKRTYWLAVLFAVGISYCRNCFIWFRKEA